MFHSGGWCEPWCINLVVRLFLLHVWGQLCELAKASFVCSHHSAVLFVFVLWLPVGCFYYFISMNFSIIPFYFEARTGPGQGQKLTDIYSPSWFSSSYIVPLTRCKWVISAGPARVMTLALECSQQAWQARELICLQGLLLDRPLPAASARMLCGKLAAVVPALCTFIHTHWFVRLSFIMTLSISDTMWLGIQEVSWPCCCWF